MAENRSRGRTTTAHLGDERTLGRSLVVGQPMECARVICYKDILANRHAFMISGLMVKSMKGAS